MENAILLYTLRTRGGGRTLVINVSSCCVHARYVPIDWRRRRPHVPLPLTRADDAVVGRRRRRRRQRLRGYNIRDRSDGGRGVRARVEWRRWRRRRWPSPWCTCGPLSGRQRWVGGAVTPRNGRAFLVSDNTGARVRERLLHVRT